MCTETEQALITIDSCASLRRVTAVMHELLRVCYGLD